MRRIYCRRGSIRRASTTQLSSGENVDVDSPAVTHEADVGKVSRAVTPRMRRKGSCPAALNMYQNAAQADQDEEDEIGRSSPFERLSRAWANGPGTGEPVGGAGAGNLSSLAAKSPRRSPPGRNGRRTPEPFSPVLEGDVSCLSFFGRISCF
jgi:hypothetical protein